MAALPLGDVVRRERSSDHQGKRNLDAISLNQGVNDEAGCGWVGEGPGRGWEVSQSKGARAANVWTGG